MYQEFYGLRSRPFSTLPDPRFLCWTQTHTLAYTILNYGVTTRAPFTVITGDVGSGKTTLLRHLLNELPEEVQLGLVSNMQDGRGDLLHWVLMAFDQEFGDEPYVKLFQKFQEFLIERYAKGKRSVLVIDEAQNLSPSTLEELRMLSNINSDQDELLQLVLVGQPQLRDLIGRPELTQFAQRICADFHLGPLSAFEVTEYIHHRLETAGAKGPIFMPETCELVHEATGGVPRLINVLCDLCLVYGFSYERDMIDPELLLEFLNSADRHGVFHQFKKIERKPALLKSCGT